MSSPLPGPQPSLRKSLRQSPSKPTYRPPLSDQALESERSISSGAGSAYTPSDDENVPNDSDEEDNAGNEEDEEDEAEEEVEDAGGDDDERMSLANEEGHGDDTAMDVDAEFIDTMAKMRRRKQKQKEADEGMQPELESEDEDEGNKGKPDLRILQWAGITEGRVTKNTRYSWDPRHQFQAREWLWNTKKSIAPIPRAMRPAAPIPEGIELNVQYDRFIARAKRAFNSLLDEEITYRSGKSACDQCQMRHSNSNWCHVGCTVVGNNPTKACGECTITGASCSFRATKTNDHRQTAHAVALHRILGRMDATTELVNSTSPSLSAATKLTILLESTRATRAALQQVQLTHGPMSLTVQAGQEVGTVLPRRAMLVE